MERSAFHPAVRAWFEASFECETPVQAEAWRAIAAEDNVLIAAPTGSGKTFAAFLCAINDLVEQSRRTPLADGVQVLHVTGTLDWPEIEASLNGHQHDGYQAFAFLHHDMGLAQAAADLVEKYITGLLDRLDNIDLPVPSL